MRYISLILLLLLTACSNENIHKEDIQELMPPLPDHILQAHTLSKLLTSRTEGRNTLAVQDYLEYPKDILF